MKKNKLTSFFVMISIFFSVTIALSIPQVVLGLRDYWDEEAVLKNGADLKVECSAVTEEFESVLSNIKEEYEVKECTVFNAVIVKEKQQIYCDLVQGEYNLKEGEMILSGNLAKSLSVSIGDELKILDTTYVVKEIEETARGVGKQGEDMGYAKVIKYDQDEKFAYSKLYLISGSNILNAKEELVKVKGDCTFTLIEDIKSESEVLINTNVMSLNMINTMSVIMTIISLISSIFLILSRCEWDIAVMKIEGIGGKVIKRAFLKQFRYYVIISVLLGSMGSVVAVFVILQSSGVSYRPGVQEFIKLLVGIVLLMLTYMAYTKQACKRIENISPLTVLRNEPVKARNGYIFRCAVMLTILFFVVYSMYVGITNVFAISLLILIVIGIFYLLFLFVIRILTCIPTRKLIRKYLFSHMWEKRHAVTLTVMSLSFTILFFLIGFTLSETIADSYSRSLKDKINYNYMMNTTQEENIIKVLRQTEDTGWYTKLGVRHVSLYGNDEKVLQAMLVAVEEEHYGVKYLIKEGVDVVDIQSDGVMLSTTFAEKYGYKLNDKIALNVLGDSVDFKIQGLYESGGMNNEHIIVNRRFVEFNGEADMYLVNTSNVSLVEGMENVYVVNLDSVGSALKKTMDKSLGIFKSLCILCVFSAMIFNINIMYMKSSEEHRNLVLMRALGIGKERLTKNVCIECLVMLILTIAMSIGVYSILINFAMKLMFSVGVNIKMQNIFISLFIALVFIFGIFTVPLTNVKKSKLFDTLREMV